MIGQRSIFITYSWKCDNLIKFHVPLSMCHDQLKAVQQIAIERIILTNLAEFDASDRVFATVESRRPDTHT